MLNREWKVNDLVVLYLKNDKDEYITDIGVINSFNNIDNQIYAEIRLLYSKFSPIDTFIYAPRNEVHIIGDINDFIANNEY